MKSKLLFLLFCLPIYINAECNHAVVDRNSKLACVTVINRYDKNLAVTGYPGFDLKPNLSEETMLLPGAGNLVTITPNPYSNHNNEKELSCRFNIKIAKENQIMITYYNNLYEVLPNEFKNNCTFKIV